MIRRFFAARWLLRIAACSAFAFPAGTRAQTDPLDLPPLESVLPEVAGRAAEADLFTAMKLHVAAYRFEGNTVFTEAQLAEVVASWTGREVSTDELEEARRALTLHYIEAGYVNSGAVLPDQAPENGVVVFRIVEGTLGGIDVQGNWWINRQYFTRRILRRVRSPLRMQDLQETIFLLNDTPGVRKLNGDLQPGGLPGEGRLKLVVTERFPIQLGLDLRNDRPVSVGAEHLDLVASHRSLTFRGDVLEARVGLVQRGGGDDVEWGGLKNYDLAYTLPLSSWDTTLRLHFSRRDYAVIEEPFAALELDSESREYGITLRQPLIRTAEQEFAISLSADHRTAETRLAGEPFTLSPGAVDGKTELTVLRLIPEWSWRTQQQAFTTRFSFNLGIDALDATKNGTDRDGRFFSITGQAQYAHRLGTKGAQVIVRTGFQWTDEPLLSLEQLPVGGVDTVRGYRENQLVRDRGVLGSIELRVPVWNSGRGTPILQLAAFYDVGGAWNVDEPTPAPRMLQSIGAGLIFTPDERVNAQLYWGYALSDVPEVEDEDLQDYGLHFRLSVLAF